MMTTPSQTDGKQLLAALISSLKMFLVALAFFVIVVALLVKSLVGFGMVALQGLNLLLTAAIAFVASVLEVSELASFLVTARR
jgi:hypothetical protein